MRNTIQNGLQDVSVSRLKSKIDWGLQVPTDPSHTIYVWLDALTNYLSCCSYPDQTIMRRSWPADYHIVGKDILKFHAIYWPAFLIAADLPLPKKIVAHGHWTVDGVKMSKSLGNVVDPVSTIETYGLNCVRYFLLREGHIGHDSNFSTTFLQERCNSELADTFGNLLSRSTGQQFIPAGSVRLPVEFEAVDKELLDQLKQLPQQVESFFQEPNVRTCYTIESRKYISSG